MGHPRSVLVVEDDSAIRELVVTVLRDAGYEVRDAPDAEAALALAAMAGARATLLVTDVDLPGASGLELAARLTEAQPGLRVLFVTGRDRLVPATPVPERWRHLPKPFTRADLVREAGALLG